MTCNVNVQQCKHVTPLRSRVLLGLKNPNLVQNPFPVLKLSAIEK